MGQGSALISREDAPIKGLELEGMIPTAEEMASLSRRKDKNR